MLKSLRGRIIFIAVILGICGYYIYANGLKLGLDLQGGMHLVVEIDDPDGTLTDEARADAIDRAETVLRTRIDELGVEEPLIQKVGSDRIIVELAGISDENQAKDVIRRAAFLEFKLVRSWVDFAPDLPRIDRVIVATLGADSLSSLGRDVEAPTSSIEELLFGAASEEGDSAAAEEGGAEAGESAAVDAEAEQVAQDDAAEAEEDDSAVLSPFTALLNQGSEDGVYLVAEEDVEAAELFLSIPEVQRAMPRDISLQWGMDPVGLTGRIYRQLYVLNEDAFITGQMLENAVSARDQQFNTPQVQFELSRRGGRRFAEVTGQNVGEFLAIVLDGEVVSAPVIRDRIGARGQIELGGSTLQEASDLALVLRAGALPAPLRIMEERTVGPSLGQDSVDQGRIAGMIGLVLVVLIMCTYYRVAGILSVFALGVYVVLVLGGLAMFGATLTVPGIAGLILSVGMAVDANVLIFERIREELDAGRAVRTAVEDGFGNALSAIVDANLTTLITALILFQFGTGPVRGFAVTLSIGILASFFTALYVTRSFFFMYLSRKRATDPISI
ncbi:MAG: protein translocase subunit SecD [Gammaproteobacteria bacterium]|nr:protein translocase subunit SecD [Gammaproteobacteria bacterium]MYF62057.1 protein translocase subunit SecD [Gammaproteobacteria bacterium]MYI23094.1 protein translocase subunit SecD [Gammaproteobacteria bacterium]